MSGQSEIDGPPASHDRQEKARDAAKPQSDRNSAGGGQPEPEFDVLSLPGSNSDLFSNPGSKSDSEAVRDHKEMQTDVMCPAPPSNSEASSNGDEVKSLFFSRHQWQWQNKTQVDRKR